MDSIRAQHIWISVVLLHGCGASTPEPEEAPPPESRTHTTVEVIREAPPPEEEPPEPMLVKGTAAPLESGEAPEVRITRPRKNGLVRRGPVAVKLAVSGWPTGAGASYVAIVVDDRLPIRVDDPSSSVELTAEVLGGAELERGSHLLRAFAVRASGESVRSDGAFAWTTFHFGRRSRDWAFDPRRPFLTPNLPGHGYEGEAAADILLDVRVTGATLGTDGHRVVVKVDEDLFGEITEDVPHHLRDLPDGANPLVLELVDAEGAVVPGPYGRVSRTIQVHRSPPEPDATE